MKIFLNLCLLQGETALVANKNISDLCNPKELRTLRKNKRLANLSTLKFGYKNAGAWKPEDEEGPL